MAQLEREKEVEAMNEIVQPLNDRAKMSREGRA